MENGTDYLLSIVIKSWNKNTEDLFDFESKDFNQSIINQSGATSEFFLIKSNDSIIKTISLKDLPFQSSSTKLFCQISPSHKNTFDILSHYASPNIHWIPEEKVEDIWLKLSKTDYTHLKIGDIVKMGRVRIKLTSDNPNKTNYEENANITSINNNCDNTIYNQIKIASVHTNDISVSKIQKDMCRICYRTDSDFENPLVAPCKCTGSMRYIHLRCLQSAIASKFTITQNSNFTMITWKSYECEVCLSEYPKYMIHKSKTYSMIDYSLITYDKCIIFDYFIYDDAKFKANRKGILIINMNEASLNSNNEITLGRTQTNQVKLKNISVSRVHCTIKVIDGQVMIKDNESKFGTLLYLRQKYTLVEGNANDGAGNGNGQDLTNRNYYYGSECVVSSGRFALFFQLTKTKSFFMNMLSFNCCKQKNINDSDCVIDLNNEESEDDDVINKKQYITNIYNDHVMIIDTILQSVDYSP